MEKLKKEAIFDGILAGKTAKQLIADGALATSVKRERGRLHALVEGKQKGPKKVLFNEETRKFSLV